jgi:hypothetical protein
MSTYDDNLLAARFAALAPEPLPGDWADVVGRVGARKGRRSPAPFRTLPGRRRRLLVVLAVIAVVAVATASAFGVRAYFVDKGFIGLPPAGATSSSPETGELVLSAYGLGGGSRTHLWVYADGRVISQRGFARPGDALPEGANELSSGYLEQRLTMEGVERIRAEATSTGLFARDRVLSLGEEPCFNLIEVMNGDRLVSVTWQGSQCPPVPGVAPAAKEQELELPHLVARLTNPTTWLPASAWREHKSRAYVPSRFAITFGARPETLEASRILALLPHSAAQLLGAKPRTRLQRFHGGAGGKTRVLYDYTSELTVEEARTLAEALDRAGLERTPTKQQAYALSYLVGEMSRPGEPGDFFFVVFEPLLPHGESACSACG